MRGVKLAAAGVALLLAGCQTTAGAGAWTKDGATDQDRMTSVYECDRDASQRNFFQNDGIIGYFRTPEVKAQCMRAKGWRETS